MVVDLLRGVCLLLRGSGLLVHSNSGLGVDCRVTWEQLDVQKMRHEGLHDHRST